MNKEPLSAQIEARGTLLFLWTKELKQHIK